MSKTKILLAGMGINPLEKIDNNCDSYWTLYELIDHCREQLTIPVVGWRSEQLPDFDVQEINDILKDCKEKKDDLQTLISRIWNKGYITAVCDERENL